MFRESEKVFIYSVKASSLKYVAVMVLCAAAITSCVLLVPDSDRAVAVSQRVAGDFKNVKSNDDRVEFLESYGWDIDPNAIEIAEVVIPSEFDEVYSSYNDIQRTEGLDLEKYSGKSVKRYTYTVKNYGSETTVLANLLIYKNRVVGGDISSSDPKGFSHGFTKLG